MNKYNLIKIIILLIVIFIVSVITLLFLNNKKNNDNNNEMQIAVEKESGIKKGYECNKFDFITTSMDDLVSIYFNEYRLYALENPEKAYNLLDEEYREKKFGNIEGYRTYAVNNKEEILNSTLESYQVGGNKDSARYICIDQNGNYYIFNENAIMDYTLILDTYTIDLPEFLEKYNSATEGQKVALNIDKFMKAINDKDYKYAYGCLADSFKNNYFKTQEEFENYAKENFYGSNNVGYKEFGTQGEYYTYSVILTDKETGEQKNKTFIMQLGEGTEFKLSFDR